MKTLKFISFKLRNIDLAEFVDFSFICMMLICAILLIFSVRLASEVSLIYSIVLSTSLFSIFVYKITKQFSVYACNITKKLILRIKQTYIEYINFEN